jgi:hypothetical protein
MEDAPAPEPPEAPPAWWLISALFLFGLPFGLAFFIFGRAASETWNLLFAVFAPQLGFLLPALVWARVSGLRVLPLLRLTRPSVAALLVGVGTAFAAVLAAYGLANLLSLHGLLPGSIGGRTAI